MKGKGILAGALFVTAAANAQSTNGVEITLVAVADVNSAYWFATGFAAGLTWGGVAWVFRTVKQAGLKGGGYEF